jgi:hypothetical protein
MDHAILHGKPFGIPLVLHVLYFNNYKVKYAAITIEVPVRYN